MAFAKTTEHWLIVQSICVNWNCVCVCSRAHCAHLFGSSHSSNSLTYSTIFKLYLSICFMAFVYTTACKHTYTYRQAHDLCVCVCAMEDKERNIKSRHRRTHSEYVIYHKFLQIRCPLQW